MRTLFEEFWRETGMTSRSWEHNAQIMQVYLHARVASLETLEPDTKATSEVFRNMARQIGSAPSSAFPKPQLTVVSEKSTLDMQSTQLPAPLPIQNETPKSAPILTEGVEIIRSDLTIKLLTEQFEIARVVDEPLHRSPNDQPYGVDFAGACKRSIKIAQNAGQMDDGRRSKIKTFCMLTGVQKVTDVEQYHFLVFEEILNNLRKNFLKPAKDALFTWSELESQALEIEDKGLGRSASTFNAYLEQVGTVLKHAKSNEESEVDAKIDPSLFRHKENIRARSKRAAFRPEEIVSLFQHPVWHGCKGDTRRQEKGDLILKDGLFFVPLLVAYSGARMEEVAGLTVDAIVEVDGHYGFDIGRVLSKCGDEGGIDDAVKVLCG